MYIVVAQRQIQAPVEKVWDHLTRPELLAKWFADTSNFGPDAPVYMETGDGDFFFGQVIEWDPGIVLGVRWKFDGCGPEYEVRFSLLRRKQGTELTVQDRGALSVEEAECMRVGWSEFLMRCEKSIVKNANTRFNWRKELIFTVAVVEGKLDALKAALSDPLWYEASLDGVSAQIDEAREELILATIKKANWGETPTSLRVKFKNIRGVNYAYFTHEGWPDLPGRLGEAERHRFVSVWLNALSDFSVDGNHSRAAVATESAR
jgi:uncharacterized protein YndB with AHSA1/START domain